MKKRPSGKAEKIGIGPLLTRLKERGISQSRFAKDHNYTAADVTNWKVRGVPRGELSKIATWCGLSVPAYLAEASSATTPRQRTLESAALLDDYNALPDGLKAIVARKAAGLRVYVDGLPPFLREALKSAPSDPEQYRKWEKEIEAAVAKRVPGVEAGEWTGTAGIHLHEPAHGYTRGRKA